MSLRRAAKCVALTALRLPLVASALRRRRRNALLILAYHGVAESEDQVINGDGFHVERGRFRRQLEELARHYRVRPLAESVRALREGSLPSNAACVTFDDGYANNATQAAPVLQELGLPATFFLTTGFLDGTSTPWWYVIRSWVARAEGSALELGARRFPVRTTEDRLRAISQLESELKSLPAARRDAEINAWVGAAPTDLPYPFMTWRDAVSLLKQGFELGAHTVSHPAMGTLSEAERVQEISLSRRRIAEMTGVEPTVFAYPYGRPADCPPAAAAALAHSGFVAAVTTTRGWNRPDTDPYRLHRMNVTQHHDHRSFPAVLAGWSG